MDVVVPRTNVLMQVGNNPVLKEVKILVVDDDNATCDLLDVFLKLYGASVYTASSVDEAWALFNTIQPDLLISDICMPRSTGHSLIQQIRALEVNKQTPAIAFTAMAREQDKQDSLDAGFQRHLAKPLEPDVLLTEILSLLELSH